MAVTCAQVNPEKNTAGSPELRYRRIGLLDHMGFGNMGDAAIHESFIQNIKKRLPEAHLISFSQNPEDTSKRHNIACYPIEWRYPGCWNDSNKAQGAGPDRTSRFKSLLEKRCGSLYRVARHARNLVRRVRHLKASYDVVKSLDLLVVAGGGQLCELWGGAWSHPYNVFTFCVLAKLANTPVVIVGVGADLLERGLSKLFAKWSVRLADYTSFRSVESQDKIRELGVKKDTHVCPDPAYALDVQRYLVSDRPVALKTVEDQGLTRNPINRALGPEQCIAADAPRVPMLKVGLNPMGFCDPRVWPRKDSAAYARYLDKLIRFSTWLLAQNYSLELFTSDIVVDKSALEDLTERLLGAVPPDVLHKVVCHPVSDLRELLFQMSEFDFVITPKFHGVVFSHLLGKPVIALSYLPKIDHLMREVGDSQYCLEIGDFEADSLIKAFASLVRSADDLVRLFGKTSATYAEALEMEFDSLFGPLGAQAANEVATENIALRVRGRIAGRYF